ncbi:MAG: dicarboxylate/amino acid:cation symporter [Fuerstiella sp.]|nr:dicarboxylate/amino acid:cation symporter [Fuerstiella sp.]
MNDQQRRSRWPLHWQILAAMVAGSLIGILANTGDQPLPNNVRVAVTRGTNRISIEEFVSRADAKVVLFRAEFDGRNAQLKNAFPALSKALGNRNQIELTAENPRVRILSTMAGYSVVWQRTHNGVPAVSRLKSAQASGLPGYWTQWINEHPSGIRSRITTIAKSIGDLFLRLLKMVTIPLILTSLVTGVTGLGSQGRFGKMFGRTLAYYLTTSFLAISVGLMMVNLIRPGSGATLPGGGEIVQTADRSLTEVIYEQLLRLVPANPFAAIANGEFLSLISFAIMVGTFINFVGGTHAKRLSELFESAFAVMLKMTGWVISLAPVGVSAFMIYATATQGLDVFATLAKYMITVFLALAIHAVVVLPVIVMMVGRRCPLAFFSNMSPALLTAFSTASSNATLPLTISCVEDRAGISNRTSSFVLPLGATINMDGTALYEVVAVLFIAQATPGVDLSFVQQVTVAFTALIASVGAAGIPHAGLVMMAIVLQAVGLPVESQGIIIAVDRVLDMCRTSVNVWSDSCGCAVIDRLTNDSNTTVDSAGQPSV